MLTWAFNGRASHCAGHLRGVWEGLSCLHVSVMCSERTTRDTNSDQLFGILNT